MVFSPSMARYYVRRLPAGCDSQDELGSNQSQTDDDDDDHWWGCWYYSTEGNITIVPAGAIGVHDDPVH
jgi:hypothetical protein